MSMPDRGQVTVDSAGALPARPRVASPTPPPASGAVPSGENWHHVTVTTTDRYGQTRTRTVEGDDAWVSASLRALADRLDPPKARPTLRQPVDPGAANMVRRGPTGGLVSVPPAPDGPRTDPMSTR